MNIHLQSIQSSLEYRISQAHILINKIDNDSGSYRLTIKESVTSLRTMIDELEKTMLQQILTTETEQKKTVGEL